MVEWTEPVVLMGLTNSHHLLSGRVKTLIALKILERCTHNMCLTEKYGLNRLTV